MLSFPSPAATVMGRRDPMEPLLRRDNIRYGMLNVKRCAPRLAAQQSLIGWILYVFFHAASRGVLHCGWNERAGSREPRAKGHEQGAGGMERGGVKRDAGCTGPPCGAVSGSRPDSNRWRGRSCGTCLAEGLEMTHNPYIGQHEYRLSLNPALGS
jgi:hypothetical protein